MRKDKGKNKTIRADKANSDTGVATSVDMGVNISDTEVDMVIATEVASANTKLDTNASIAAMNESVKIANTNETLRIETKRARRLFATVADVSSVLMALVYISYVTMLLIFEVGQVWLNWAMLGVAFAYIIFFGIKIFVLNRNNPSLRMRRITNRIYKYTKYGMRIINAAFIIFSIIVVGEDQSLIALVGVVILIVTFIIAVFWDILTMVVRRRLKDLYKAWSELGAESRTEKIEHFIKIALDSLENMTDFDKYLELGKGVSKRVGTRFTGDRE